MATPKVNSSEASNETATPTPAQPEKASKPVVPEGPWTVESLGYEKYRELAKAYMGFDPDVPVGGTKYTPALDLTPYYQGGAK